MLGLVGDNGAGKSTLVKILSGLYKQDGGDLLIEGEPVSFRSVEAARGHGIETVYQDLALIPQLPVYQNLFLGHELTKLGPLRLLDKREMRRLSREYLDDIHVAVPSVDAEAEQLSGGQRQAIAVARSLRAATKILLLDEPLAAMGARESRLIVDLVKDLASSGRVSIIVIDHNYAHLFELCDRLNVMEGGRITIDQKIDVDVARAAHGAHGLELPPPGGGGSERRRLNPARGGVDVDTRSGSTSERSRAGRSCSTSTPARSWRSRWCRTRMA